MTLFAEQPGLLEPFRRGERAALEAVYRRYVADVLRMLRNGFASQTVRVSGILDRELLLDAVQEVFLRAFGAPARAGYDASRPYRPYLFRIARNLRIDQLRRSGREIPFPATDADEGEDDIVVSEVASSPEDPETRDLKARVRRYVASLGDEQRTFVELRFCDELSQEQIAERMQVTRRRARTLESNVLSGLRRWLGDEGS